MINIKINSNKKGVRKMLQKINEEVRTELREYLEKHGVMQKFVSEKTGLSKTSISMFLNNQRNLTEDHLKKIIDLISK